MGCARSMTDIAYDILSKKKRAVAFIKLWEEVKKEGNISADAIAQFYSDLSLDVRFVSLKENKWDLTERRKYAESHVDLSKIELEEDEPEEEETEEETIVSNDSEDEY